MKPVTFDYANTCPKIDRAIAGAKSEIESFLIDFIEELSPFVPKKERDRIASDYAANLYSNLEDAFEEVRSTNEDMRREAESQIDSLARRMAELEHDLEAAS